MKVKNLFKISALFLFITGTSVSAKEKDIIDTVLWSPIDNYYFTLAVWGGY